MLPRCHCSLLLKNHLLIEILTCQLKFVLIILMHEHYSTHCITLGLVVSILRLYYKHVLCNHSCFKSIAHDGKEFSRDGYLVLKHYIEVQSN